MAAFINTNVASLNAQRNLTASQSNVTTALQRLSSGLRINSAKDDAAGLAISERMTSQIRGYNQAGRNANDGISLAQTAEGALGEVANNLQRIRELALQSANSTNSASDRDALNAEAQQLLSEIQRVSSTTQFNGLNLLDGSFSSAQFQVGANANQTISVTISGSSTNLIGAYQATSAAVTANAFDGAGFTINGVEIGASAATSAAGVTADSATAKATAINAKSSDTGVTAVATNSVEGEAPIAGAGLASGALKINGVAVGAIASSASAVTQGNNAATAINAVSNQTGVTATADASTGALTLTAADGRNIELTAGTATGAGATAIQNATGLDVSTAGNASGHDTFNITVAAAGVFDADDSAAAAGNLTSGDTVVLDGVTYEFYDSGTTYAGSNVGVGLADTADNEAIATALAGAIDAQRAAGNTTIDASAAAGVITITNTLYGAQGTAAGWDDTGVANGNTALVDGAETAGTDAADGDGMTTRGTLTLSSANSFTTGGADVAYAGLSSASAALTQLSTVDISDVAGSNAAIAVLDGALSQISSQRASLGAFQNRFTSVVSSLQTSSENLSAARSRIMDADFAAETAAMTRGQILQQAGTAMLAQANSLPNGVLALLRG
jgi:flagellin